MIFSYLQCYPRGFVADYFKFISKNQLIIISSKFFEFNYVKLNQLKYK